MLYRTRDIYLEHELEPYGLGPSQLRILLALHRRLHHDVGINQTEIAHHLHLDKGAMAKSIKKLEDHGYIKRERSEEDHREYRILITDKAHSKIHELHDIRKRWSHILSKGFSAEDKKMALHYLQKMAENAEHFFHHSHKEKKGT
jgi:DNA-binding MarR family transcriptional regulator